MHIVEVAKREKHARLEEKKDEEVLANYREQRLEKGLIEI